MMRNINPFSRINPYITPYRKELLLAIFLQALGVFMSVIEPFIFGLIITEIGHNVADIAQGIPGAGINYEYIFQLLFIYFIRGTTFHLSTYGSNFYITEAVQQMIRDLRADMISKINRLPVAYFDRHQFGDILNRLTSDVESISNAFQQSLLQLVNAVLTIVFVIGMMFFINWQLALIVMLVLPLSAVMALLVIRRSQPYFKQQADVLGDLNGFVQENFSGFEILKLFGREEISYDDFTKVTDNLETVGFKASFISGLLRPALGFITNAGYVVVAAIGGYLAIQGRLSIGNIQAFAQYVWQISNPIQIFTQISGLLQSASAAVTRVFEILDHPEEEQDYAITLDEPITGQVSFNHVDFQYTPEKPLIQNFDVDVTPGEMIAIVGPTGAGKTTMINLLMRFYDVDNGKITVDNMDIRDIKRQDYRSQFGMVLQDTWLFEGTVRENLRFGNLSATDEQIVAAAEATNVDHFIRTLPHGYDMVIDQESSNISQGQKQLLTIARALLSDPQILILDEATSSVDTRMEKLIQEAMDRLMEGRTSFVIAHRLSTIQNADRILVMRDGQIIEHGNHDELLRQRGFYYDLYNSQFAEG